MKRILPILILSAISLYIFANIPYLHVYRNDDSFNSSRLGDVSSVQFLSTEWGDTLDGLVYHYVNGFTDTIPAFAIDSTVIGTNVPAIYINLLDYPDIDDLYKTGGFNKTTIYRAVIEIEGNGVYEDVPPTEVEFRGRGNTTWKYPKTPYRFKFPKKQSICGFTKAKTYALIANYLDGSLMKNTAALAFARALGMPYTNHTVPVNVFLNGRYKGAYFLTEKIGITGASVDIDEEKGMLFEIDKNYDEDFKFRYEFIHDSVLRYLPIMVKDPDLYELEANGVLDTLDAVSYFDIWQQDLRNVLDTIMTRPDSVSLADVLDINSVADFILVNHLSKNREIIHPKSVFFYKESLDSGQVYHFGPVWDFDWGFTYYGNDSKGKYDMTLLVDHPSVNGAYFFIKLMSNHEIRDTFDARFNKFRTELWPDVKEYLHNYKESMVPSAMLNGRRWPADPSRGTLSSFHIHERYDSLIQFIENRIQFIDTAANHGLWD